MSLSATEAKVVARLRTMAPELRELLGRLVGTSSHTADHEGVNRVGLEVERELMISGLRVGAFVTGRSGQHMIARHPASTGHRLLLLGHLDTVHPRADEDPTLSADPTRPGILLGPGAADMKGGLVVMLAAIRALALEGQLEGRALSVLLSADEETGSPTARDLIAQEAEDHHLCLVFECGRDLGGGRSSFVVRRRGMMRSTLRIEGIEAHSGVDKAAGVSALLDAAHRVIALEALDDESSGQAVNVGVLRSGTAPNTVPGEALLEIDARFDDPDAGDSLQAAIRAVCTRPGPEQGRARRQAVLDFREGPRHEPMATSAAMQRMADRIVLWGRDLGLELVPEARGGASDGNIAAAHGCPTIDGLGSVGGRIHSAEEWVDESSLVDRAALCALTMMRFYEL
ncbi:MAG: M20/M25/M40 family metallo-hydrolase [Planctomycetes bacterium]|nr:M20/M25/M40 family metallo-hydrolase [Planctomycetota bacterium]